MAPNRVACKHCKHYFSKMNGKMIKRNVFSTSFKVNEKKPSSLSLFYPETMHCIAMTRNEDTKLSSMWLESQRERERERERERKP